MPVMSAQMRASNVSLPDPPPSPNPRMEACRTRCNKILKKLFPEPGEAALGEWNHHNALELMAIFDLARIFRLSGPQNALLPKETILRALYKLATSPPFYDYGETSLLELECYLRLLSSALRLYKCDNTTLRSDIHTKIYNAITAINGIFSDDKSVNKKIANMYIERQNVVFLVKHSQYLLVSIKSAETMVEAGFRRAVLLAESAANARGGQLNDARTQAIEALSRQRSRSKWHDEYIRMEDACFEIYAEEVGTLLATTTGPDDERWQNVAVKLRESLEEQLESDQPRRAYSVINLGRKVFGKTTELVQSAGPYEEHMEYLNYGILDLMFEMTFHVERRTECFNIFVRAVKLAFERTHRSAREVHRKAFDLYQRIQALSEADGVQYGLPEDREWIENWLSSHDNEERKRIMDTSMNRVTRLNADLTAIQKLKTHMIEGIQAESQAVTTLQPTLSPRPVPTTQATLASNIFPTVPSREASTLSEMFPAVPSETPRPSTAVSHSPVAIALETTTHLTEEPEQIPPSTETESRRIVTVEDLIQNPTDPSAIEILAPLFARADVRHAVEEYNFNRGIEMATSTDRSNSAFSNLHARHQSTVRQVQSHDSIQQAAQPLWNSPPLVPSLREPLRTGSIVTLPNSPVTPLPPTNHQGQHEAPLIVFDNDDHHSLPSPPPPSFIQPSVRQLSISPPRPATLENSSVTSPRSPSRITRKSTFETTISKVVRKQSLSNYSGYAQRRADFDLLKLHGKPRTKNSLGLSAISSTGRIVAALVKSQFWIFNPESHQLLCTGEFEKKKKYKYATADGHELKLQHPLPPKFSISSFTCCALSDDYLAIGTDSKIMIFSVSGQFVGRWLACDDIPGAMVKKLVFSPEGKELVALVSIPDENSDGARIYTTANFIPPHARNGEIDILRQRAMAPTPVPWPRDFVHNPNDIAFSANGEMVAVCTTHSEAKAQIRILKKEISTWRNWGATEVPVHTSDVRDGVGLGLTGISFYGHDECIVLSVESANPNAADCYRIVRERTSFRLERASQVVSGSKGTNNLGIAVSQAYHAVALISKKGVLQIRPDGQLPGTLSEHGTSVDNHERTSLAFDGTGRRLIYIDEKAVLTIYDFYDGKLGEVKQLPMIPIMDQ